MCVCVCAHAVNSATCTQKNIFCAALTRQGSVHGWTRSGGSDWGREGPRLWRWEKKIEPGTLKPHSLPPPHMCQDRDEVPVEVDGLVESQQHSLVNPHLSLHRL